MKILAIRIKNLASLEGETEINFTQEPLCSAGIFAITGPTGAGKSTILDALCLALYGKTPRYLQAKELNIEVQDVQGSTIAQGDVRGILRDGTADGFAEVDFLGIDNQKYRSKWSVRRANNKVLGSLQAYGVSLINITANQEFPGKKTEILCEIERLVGLNFEQFTRSVLLAQGDFTAFLKAAKDEKSSLLEKLTGTQIYSEISKRIFERCKSETLSLNQLTLQREGIPILTSEELETFSNRKTELQGLIQDSESQMTRLGQEIAWFGQWDVLQTNLQQAAESLSLATQNKTSSATRAEKLKQVEQVQQTRTWVEGLQNTGDQLLSKSAALKQLEAQLQQLTREEENLGKQLTEAVAALERNIKNGEDARPLLDKAKALDVQLKEKETQVAKASQELEARKRAYEENAKRLEQKHQDATQLQEEIQKLARWKEDNKSRQLIAENDKLILSKLKDAHQLLENLNTLEKEALKASQSLQDKTEEKALLQKSLSGYEQTFQQEKDKCCTAEDELAVISITNLEQEKAGLDQTIEEVIIASSHWSVLYKTGKETEQLHASVSHKSEELQTKTGELAQYGADLKVSTIQLSTSRSILDRARLAVTESVEALRATLAPHEPCLVCGSLDHPYVTHNPKQEFVLSHLESEYKALEYAHNGQVREEARLKEACRQLTESIQTQQAELLSKTTLLQDLESKWTQFQISKEAAHHPREQVEAWLQQKLKEGRETQKKLQTQISAYQSKKEQVETQKNRLRELEKKTTEIADKIKELERTLLSLAEKKAQHTHDQEKLNKQLTDLKEALVPFFQSDKWYQNWKKDAAGFEQSISAFATQWKENAEKTLQRVQDQNILSTTIQSLTENVKEQQEELEKKAAALTELQTDYTEYKKERNAIFNGKPVPQIEEELRSAIESAKQLADTEKAKKEKIHTELTRTIAQKEQGEKEIASCTQQKTELEQKIQTWIQKYNLEKAAHLTVAALTELLHFNHDWIVTERHALKAIEEALTKAQSVLTEREVALEKHKASRLSQQSLEELKGAEAKLKTDIQELTKESNEIHFKLRQDEDNKQKLGTLIQAIEAKAQTAENWEKLNDIIGSADGKKFRQIAQEYTLDALLSYANIHLEMLSKRYMLQRIPNTLGLQVLDQDMGDEVRTVFSLSGGESFLVSLALALGLASLSSNRMKVESLFIDEGFGSLDPNTLNLAMDALERLQNQGRKVGVISHVQEMTERIPVQIKVSKMSSGKSRVEVV